MLDQRRIDVDDDDAEVAVEQRYVERPDGPKIIRDKTIEAVVEKMRKEGASPAELEVLKAVFQQVNDDAWQRWETDNDASEAANEATEADGL